MLSQCIAEMLRRSGDWAGRLEQSLHASAAAAICDLVAQVKHPHMSACADVVLPVVCEVCCHFDAVHRGFGARALMNFMCEADKVVLRLHKDIILKVCGVRSHVTVAFFTFATLRK
jgi:hypothetical protein